MVSCDATMDEPAVPVRESLDDLLASLRQPRAAVKPLGLFPGLRAAAGRSRRRRGSCAYGSGLGALKYTGTRQLFVTIREVAPAASRTFQPRLAAGLFLFVPSGSVLI
jgi:hypothetical protein